GRTSRPEASSSSFADSRSPVTAWTRPPRTYRWCRERPEAPTRVPPRIARSTSVMSAGHREEPRGRAVAPADLVEGRVELDPRGRQGREVGHLLHQEDSVAEQDAMADEVLGGEVGQPGAVLL